MTIRSGEATGTALAMATDRIMAGNARKVLVIGAEVFSRILDWKDRGTCILFGDGAGAVIVSASAGDEFHWGEALLNAAILTAGSWVIFIWGLNLTIPLWPSFLSR